MIASYLTSEIKHKLFKCSDGRNGAKDPSWTRRKMTVFNDVELDRLGIIGEYAAGDILNVKIDWTVSVHGDNGHDLVLQNGWKAAVKFNHRYQGFLMVEGRDGDTDDELVDLTSDVLILVHGFCNPKKGQACSCENRLLNPDVASSVIVAGWISRADFMVKKVLKNWNAGDRWMVEVCDLRPIQELIALAHLHVPAILIGGKKPPIPYKRPAWRG